MALCSTIWDVFTFLLSLATSTSFDQFSSAYFLFMEMGDPEVSLHFLLVFGFCINWQNLFITVPSILSSLQCPQNFCGFLINLMTQNNTYNSFGAGSRYGLNSCYLGKSGCCGAVLLRFLAALLSSLEILLCSALFLSEAITKGLKDKYLIGFLPQAVFYFENLLLTGESRDEKQFSFPIKKPWSLYSPSIVNLLWVSYFSTLLFFVEAYQYAGSKSH